MISKKSSQYSDVLSSGYFFRLHIFREVQMKKIKASNSPNMKAL